MRSIIFSFIFLGFVGCASRPSAGGDVFQTRIFQGSYDEVWLAALKAMSDYPLKVSNKDSGRIHSEVVNGPYNELLFSHPDNIELPERFRYSLKLNFAKLSTEGKKPLIRIRIIKDLEQFQDFYVGWQAFPSDGIEEKVLLYRVEHILNMERTAAETE